VEENGKETKMSEEHHEFSAVKTIRIGFAFFIASLFWPIYNSYVPLFLDYFYQKQLPKNFIMTIDNFFALSVIPLFAFLSDRTLSRFGRRKPYIFIGTIVSAVLYAIFPNVRTVLPLFLLVLFTVNFSMASFRGPAVSLMPDLVPAEDRSKGNGIVTLMAGLAGLLVFLTGAFFYAKDPAYPFYYVSALMILSLIPLIGIKEPSGMAQGEKRKSILTIVRELKGKNLIKMILPIVLWGMAMTGVEATLSNYLTKFLDVEPHMVTIPTAAYALAALVFAVPAGYISTRIGKKRGLILGLAGMTLMFSLNGLIGTVIPFNFILLSVCTGLIGVFGAFVAVNAYPLAVEDIDPEEIGSYSGLYYFFTNFHPILGPLLLGAIIDAIGFSIMYFYGAIGHGLAMLVVIFLPLYEVRKHVS
jgi:maltose/moltooligosaccharide transporter